MHQPALCAYPKEKSGQNATSSIQIKHTSRRLILYAVQPYCCLIFFIRIRQSAISTLFPFTTLFLSQPALCAYPKEKSGQNATSSIQLKHTSRRLILHAV